MSDARAKELIDLGNTLFTKKEPLNALNQEIAEVFYTARATFTKGSDYIGRDLSADTYDSYPNLIRRELGNTLSATLRPRDARWFRTTTLDTKRDQIPENARFLEYIDDVMRTEVYFPDAQFVRATKEGDHDFVTFGQCVISVEESPDRSHIYFRTHHLRDCAWLENDTGAVDHLHRKDRMSARVMLRRFGEKACHRTVCEAGKKDPSLEFDVRCVMMPSDEYDLTTTVTGKSRGGKRMPFVLIYVDASNGKMLREYPAPDFLFVVPRWQTLPGIQYAIAPTTSVALPDGRLSQAVAQMILEAGEKSIDPPLLANAEVVREANLAAGAITWADLDGDRKLADAMQALNINADMRTAFAMRTDLRDMLAKAFFIDKLALPEATDKMTATEIRARLEEHVRNLLPLFEPMEHEYNGKLLDKTFTRLRAMGKFRRMAEMPDDLSQANVTWSFRNPLQEASERILASQFREAIEIEMLATKVGVTVPRVSFTRARDDAIRGIGVTSTWRRTEADMLAEAQEQAARAKLQAAGQQAAQIAEIGQQAGDAAQALQVAGLLPPPGSSAPDAAAPLPEIEIPEAELLEDDGTMPAPYGMPNDEETMV